MRAESQTRAESRPRAETDTREAKLTRAEQIRAVAAEIAEYHEREAERREACKRLPKLRDAFVQAQQVFIDLDERHHAAVVAEADAVRGLVCLPGNVLPSPEAEAAMIDARRVRQELDAQLERAADEAHALQREAALVVPLAKRGDRARLAALERQARMLTADALRFSNAAQEKVVEVAGQLAGYERKLREATAVRDSLARRAQASQSLIDIRDTNEAHGAVAAALAVVDQARQELAAANVLAHLAGIDLEAARAICDEGRAS